jgi:hypothetical protein
MGISFTGERLGYHFYLDVHSSTARSETLLRRHEACSQRAAPAEHEPCVADDERDFKATRM